LLAQPDQHCFVTGQRLEVLSPPQVCFARLASRIPLSPELRLSHAPFERGQGHAENSRRFLVFRLHFPQLTQLCEINLEPRRLRRRIRRSNRFFLDFRFRPLHDGGGEMQNSETHNLLRRFRVLMTGRETALMDLARHCRGLEYQLRDANMHHTADGLLGHLAELDRIDREIEAIVAQNPAEALRLMTSILQKEADRF
jgi:hypothetical protein